MKKRLTHWKSTIPAALTLVFLCVCVAVKPSLIDNPEILAGLGAAVLGLFYRGRSSNG